MLGAAWYCCWGAAIRWLVLAAAHADMCCCCAAAHPPLPHLSCEPLSCCLPLLCAVLQGLKHKNQVHVEVY
jgi:hypothetical protein